MSVYMRKIGNHEYWYESIWDRENKKHKQRYLGKVGKFDSYDTAEASLQLAKLSSENKRLKEELDLLKRTSQKLKRNVEK